MMMRGLSLTALLIAPTLSVIFVNTGFAGGNGESIECRGKRIYRCDDSAVANGGANGCIIIEQWEDIKRQCAGSSGDSSGSSYSGANMNIAGRALEAGYSPVQAALLQGSFDFGAALGASLFSGPSQADLARQAEAKRQAELAEQARLLELKRQEEERRRKFEAEKSDLLGHFKMEGGGSGSGDLQFKDPGDDYGMPDFAFTHAWSEHRRAVLAHLKKLAADAKDDSEQSDKAKGREKWCKLHLPLVQDAPALDRWEQACNGDGGVPPVTVPRHAAREEATARKEAPGSGELQFKDPNEDMGRRQRAQETPAAPPPKTELAFKSDDEPASRAETTGRQPAEESESTPAQPRDQAEAGGRPEAGAEQNDSAAAPKDISDIKALQNKEPGRGDSRSQTLEQDHTDASSGFDDTHPLRTRGKAEAPTEPGARPADQPAAPRRSTRTRAEREAPSDDAPTPQAPSGGTRMVAALPRGTPPVHAAPPSKPGVDYSHGAPDMERPWGTPEEVARMTSRRKPSSAFDPYPYIDKVLSIAEGKGWEKIKEAGWSHAVPGLPGMEKIFENEAKLPEFILPKVMAAATGDLSVEEADRLLPESVAMLYNTGFGPAGAIQHVMEVGSFEKGMAEYTIGHVGEVVQGKLQEGITDVAAAWGASWRWRNGERSGKSSSQKVQHILWRGQKEYLIDAAHLATRYEDNLEQAYKAWKSAGAADKGSDE